ncbi:MAG: hypothetical protein LBL71_00070 [Endomicrobium sp.]|jgi:hypothetical protein|nr:hypothetical protein [Endomicrobium sp.]
MKGKEYPEKKENIRLVLFKNPYVTATLSNVSGRLEAKKLAENTAAAGIMKAKNFLFILIIRLLF